MKIHLNHPTPWDLLTTARQLAGVSHARIERSGSKTRHCKFDVILEGESGRRTNQRWYSGEQGVEAATWDQWGIYLAVIFDADPEAKTDYYADAEDFHTQTGGRFDRDCVNADGYDGFVLSQSSPDYKITAHRWQYDAATSQPWSGRRTFYCKGHSAKRNMRAECKAVRSW